MTDDDDARGADGWAVMHQPDDGGEPYCLGPYPPIDHDAMATFVADQLCPCTRTLMPLGFPKGIKMYMALDLETATAVGLLPTPGQVH